MIVVCFHLGTPALNYCDPDFDLYFRFHEWTSGNVCACSLTFHGQLSASTLSVCCVYMTRWKISLNLGFFYLYLFIIYPGGLVDVRCLKWCESWNSFQWENEEFWVLEGALCWNWHFVLSWFCVSRVQWLGKKRRMGHIQRDILLLYLISKEWSYLILSVCGSWLPA